MLDRRCKGIMRCMVCRGAVCPAGPRLGHSRTMTKRRSFALHQTSMRRSGSMQGPRSAIMQVIGPEVSLPGPGAGMARAHKGGC